MPGFVHLHTHTEYSLLDGAARINPLVQKACDCGMSHLAITDHGNMYGAPSFVLACNKQGVRPIIGQEFYLAGRTRLEPSTNKNDEDDTSGANPTYHQILWAKNETGYHNLVKLSSLGFTEGFYRKPRIDKELLAQYSEGLIASTCCLASEINQTIIKKGPEAAEELFRWWLDRFGQDYYIELQRHGLQDQDRCNAVLLQWAQRYPQVKVIATNDVHYVDQGDSTAHDLLLALQTGRDYDDTAQHPQDTRGRFRFTYDDRTQLNPNFYFKTAEEMAQLFSDAPYALDNTLELAGKCEFDLKLKGDLLLPNFTVPPPFQDEDAYLAHLSFEGAKLKYGDGGGGVPTDVQDRIRQELKIIKEKGYAGYFLITQDFTNEARRRGVLVGPGRGSAAGSVVAYVTGIIDVDPIRYQLLFERFLNPDRVSPPDIDIDFDDEGRSKVLDYVVEKYGRESVCQIITYGTMGAKTAIRDVGRTLKVSLDEVNRIAKWIPEKPGFTSFAAALDPKKNPDGAAPLKEAFEHPDERIRLMLESAQRLEGATRQTGIHAAGVIIAPGKLTDYAPIALSKDKSVTTQYEGPMAELAGLLKMDFLGLKTLSILKSAQRLVQQRHGVEIDLDTIPLDDEHTYALYQRGDTVATFQFESDGMRRYLRQLKPTNIEDLIAMNALYRPGPMDNIPSFINRKHGREPIEYPHPLLEPILNNTYGIMVYQEQIMQAAQVLAGFSLGQADLLRRAMGKKKLEEMEKMKTVFVEGAAKRDIGQEKALEVFALMEKFASYGFNKSHAAAYSILAFRTGYFKAHYPAEFMAAVLSHNLDNTDKLTFFMEECRRMGISVLQPDVNESLLDFSVNEEGAIRYGLGGIKNVGESAVQSLIDERLANGPFADIFDLVSRVSLKQLNKKTLEGLAYAGALDNLGRQHRAQYFAEQNGAPMLDRIVQYGQRKQEEANSSQASLFGGEMAAQEMPQPEFPPCEAWSLLERLNREREAIGFYLSGHPLDPYREVIRKFAQGDLNSLEDYKNKDVKLAGIVTQAAERTSRSGTRFGVFTLEDYRGALSFMLFREQYANLSKFLQLDHAVLVSGRYEPSYRDPEVFELRVKGVRLLEELLTDVKELRLELSVHQLGPEFNQQLHHTLNAHPGKCPVSLLLSSSDQSPALRLRTAARVAPLAELFTALNDLSIRYSLN